MGYVPLALVPLRLANAREEKSGEVMYLWHECLGEDLLPGRRVDVVHQLEQRLPLQVLALLVALRTRQEKKRGQILLRRSFRVAPSQERKVIRGRQADGNRLDATCCIVNTLLLSL